MAGTGGKAEARFPISFEGNAAAFSREAATAVEQLRQRIQASDASVKAMSDSLRRLRGSSEEVKSAKAQLTAKIDAERVAISSANVALLKHGTSVEGLAQQSKVAATAQKDLEKKTKESKAAHDSNIESLKAGAAAGLAVVGVYIAMAAAIADSVVALGKWIAGSANALRTMNLLREATLGSKVNAANLGTQVDALANKVPKSKVEINDMANSLELAGVHGVVLVDTLNAVTQASSAVGDQAGAKLKEMVERGRLTRNFFASPFDLQGTGLAFEDLANAVASQMKTTVAEARMALLQGRVSIGDGAAALRAATEKRFGKVNLAKMLDLDVMKEKLGESLVALTSDVDIEPLLNDVHELIELVSPTTVTGQGIKQLVTLIGKGLVGAVHESVPVVKGFVQGLVIGALDLAITYYKVKIALKDTFGDAKIKTDIDVVQKSMEAGRVVAWGLAAGVAGIAGSVALFTAGGVAGLVLVYESIKGAAVYVTKLSGGLMGVKKAAEGVNWREIGVNILDGIFGPLSPENIEKKAAVVVDTLKNSLQKKLEIHSPSRLMHREVGEDVGAGVMGGAVAGIEDGTPKAALALGGMGGAGGSSSSGASRGPTEFNVTVVFQGGGGNAEDELVSPAFKEQFRAMIRDLLRSGVGEVPA